jgi:hypothetical protein
MILHHLRDSAAGRVAPETGGFRSCRCNSRIRQRLRSRSTKSIRLGTESARRKNSTTGQQGVLELKRNREDALLARAEESAMTRSNYHLMIDRGRKAGLSTRELYLALLTQPIESSEQPGQMDCNGVVSTVTPEGHRGYRPGRSSAAQRPA